MATDKKTKIFTPMRIVFAAVIAISLFATGCNKQLDIDSTRQENEEGHYTKFEDARSGLIGLYGLFRAAIAENNAHWMWGEFRMGDFTSVSRPDLQAVMDNNLNATYPVIEGLTNWRRFYAVVNACNLYLERVAGCLEDKRYTESYYKLDVAQARSIRAFVYFYLVRIWGDVPLITSSQDGGEFPEIARSSEATVLAFAEKELQEAAPRLPYIYSGIDPEQKFPNNYYGQTAAQWLNAPITRLGAYAILAHIAAWQSHYIDVLTYTDFIVNNASKANVTAVTTASLVGSFFNGATANNYNQIVSFKFDKFDGESTTDGHIESLTLANTATFYMSRNIPDIYVTKAKISEIFPSEYPNDQRFGVDPDSKAQLYYTNYFENYNSLIPIFKKIRIADGSTSTGKFAVFNSAIVFTRLEEIRLLRAEANAVLGYPVQALTDVNSVRANRGAPGIAMSEGKDVVLEIFAERRRELMGEGWRWYDLVRYNRIKRNNPAFNILLDQGGVYWPLSQQVLSRNSKLTQNPYWQ